MNISTIQIKDIRPYEKNARNNKNSVDKVTQSIKEFGFKVPIVLDKNNVIVCGHTRYEAAKKLKMAEVPCVIADDLTENQIKAYRLADNKVAEFATWDFDILKDELFAIDDIDMSDFGFDLAFGEDEEMEVQEDDYITEIPKEPKSKRGDIYQLGRHRLMCGDSTSVADFEKLMNGEIADIAFTSPPYNAGTTITETMSNKTTKYNGNDDNKSDDEYIEFLNSYLKNTLNHSHYSFMNVQSIANNKIALIDVLYQNKNIYADTIIWDKIHGAPAMAENVLNSAFEYVHVFSKKANRAIGTKKFRGTLQNIIHIPSQRNNKYADIHNATFSIEFASHFIKEFSTDSVLDPFGGTGTTMIACEQLNKTCYMMEYEPLYIDVIIDRWEQFTGEKAVLIEEREVET